MVHTATPLPDGGVLMVGGEDNDDVSASAEVWDPVTRPSAPQARWQRDVWVIPRPSCPTAVSSSSVVATSVVALAMVPAPAEVWDPATATFGPAGSLAERRVGHTATLLPDGRVLIVGGSPSKTTVHAGDLGPATASFAPEGSLAQDRLGHTVTLLPDGGVLVIGGRDDPTTMSSPQPRSGTRHDIVRPWLPRRQGTPEPHRHGPSRRPCHRSRLAGATTAPCPRLGGGSGTRRRHPSARPVDLPKEEATATPRRCCPTAASCDRWLGELAGDPLGLSRSGNPAIDKWEQ